MGHQPKQKRVNGKKKFIMEEKRVNARKIQSGVKICQKVPQFGT